MRRFPSTSTVTPADANQIRGPVRISEPSLEAGPMVLTVDEAAELLRVDRKTVYESIRRGELPGVVRLGRSIRIGRGALLEFLAGQGRVSRQGKIP